MKESDSARDSFAFSADDDTTILVPESSDAVTYSGLDNSSPDPDGIDWGFEAVEGDGSIRFVTPMHDVRAEQARQVETTDNTTLVTAAPLGDPDETTQVTADPAISGGTNELERGQCYRCG